MFSEKWAAANRDAAIGFLRSLRAAKEILATSDAEWERLRPLIKVDDDATFRLLRDYYRTGIPASFNDRDIAAAAQLFSTLAQYGGRDLVGDSTSIARGTFWSEFRY